MHTNSAKLFTRYATRFFHTNMKVLEIGPDKVPSTYYNLVKKSKNITWDTIEMANSRYATSTTYVTTNEYRFPIPNKVYDVVLSGQVIEHVRKIWVWIKELARVCKKGGYVITICPVSWPYHEAPVDCWRIYPEGMRNLYEEAGLKVLLNRCETLEVPSGWKIIPGISAPPRNPNTIIRRLLRLPIECAIDTITIGKKI